MDNLLGKVQGAFKATFDVTPETVTLENCPG